MNLTERIDRIEPSPTLAMSAKADEMRASGVDVISLSAGEPDFDTPPPIVEAAERALEAGKTRYTATRGIEPLRRGIAEDYARRGRDVGADQVVTTVGAKHALYNASQVLFESGDRVLVPSPYWVSYPAQLELAGAEPAVLECDLETDFKVTPEELERAIVDSEATGLILCSPDNPTGAVYSEDELEALGEVLTRHDEVSILFDAIYDELSYQSDLASDLVATVPELGDRTVTINGFSKSHAMTGWRLGYAIGPTDVIDAMTKLQSQATSNVTTFVQHAAVEAFELDSSVVADFRTTFRERRDLVVDRLQSISGVACDAPDGAFYVFPDVSSHVGEDRRFDDDWALAEHLLEEGHVATVPGSAFGAPGYIRLSYATDRASLEEGLDRFESIL
jgi:aspartate aminotransferase